jgi:hypothetical protein
MFPMYKPGHQGDVLAIAAFEDLLDREVVLLSHEPVIDNGGGGIDSAVQQSTKQ